MQGESDCLIGGKCYFELAQHGSDLSMRQVTLVERRSHLFG